MAAPPHLAAAHQRARAPPAARRAAVQVPLVLLLALLLCHPGRAAQDANSADDGGYTFVANWGGFSGSSNTGKFLNPYGITRDVYGNFFVLDSGNQRVQKFASDFTFLLSWGTYGNKPSQFFFPEGITTDSQGNVYVTDGGTFRIQKFSNDGSFIHEWRPSGGTEDEIVGIACDSRDVLYVAEKKNKSVQRFTVSGTALGKWTTTNQDGPGGQLFTSPSYVAVDKNDNIYVAESGAAETAGLIKKLSIDGNLLAQWGTKGIDVSQFGNGIGGIATDANGDIFVSDPYNNRIQKFAPDGIFLLKFGSQGSQMSNMEYVKGLTVAPDGGVFVTDAGHNAVKKYGGDAVPRPPRPPPPDPPPPVPEPPPPKPRPPPPRQTRMTSIPGVATSYTYQMKWGSDALSDGFVFDIGNFINPYDIATDSAGFFYVLDSGNYRVQKFTPWFSFVLEWGTYGRGKSQFILPESIAVDPEDRIYVTDSKQSRVQVFDKNGEWLWDWSTRPGPTEILGIAVDSKLTVYVADRLGQRVQRYKHDGTFLGEWKDLPFGDGTATEPFDSPSYLAVDRRGGRDIVYVAEYAVTGIDGVVKKIDRDGNLKQMWGTFGTGTSGFQGTAGVAVDLAGDVFVVDPGNCRIQKFRPSGRFITAIYGGCVGKNPKAKEFNYAKGITIDEGGNAWVTDDGRNLIMKFIPQFTDPAPPWWNANTCVESLVTQCSTCNNDYSECLKCRAGYTPSGLGCKKSAGCTVSQTTKCTKCSADGTKCLACQAGYTVSGSGCTPANAACKVSAGTKCTKCSADGTKCLACKAGYVASGAGCVLAPCQVSTTTKCTSCSANGQTCLACSAGYAPLGAGCSANMCTVSATTKCTQCSADKKRCLACQARYSPAGMGCEPNLCEVSRFTRCTKCSANRLACLACEPGWRPQGLGCTPAAGPCVVSTATKCTQCSANLQTCLACSRGYVPKGSGCTAAPSGKCQMHGFACRKTQDCCAGLTCENRGDGNLCLP